MADKPTDFDQLLESAAKLQAAVPDAVLVGGAAAVIHTRHRMSYDHDHVVADLKERYDVVLDAVENIGGWELDENASKPRMTIMGSLDGYQVGLRDLRRSRPLEVVTVELPSGQQLTIPTADETLRVKASLVVQ